jgi:MFS family permease
MSFLQFWYLIGSLEIDNVGGWRYMFGFSAPITAVMAVGMWTLPPSPKWLLLRAVQGKGSMEDNKKKAIQALRNLRGRSASDKVLADDIDDTINSVPRISSHRSQGPLHQPVYSRFPGVSQT